MTIKDSIRQREEFFSSHTEEVLDRWQSIINSNENDKGYPYLKNGKKMFLEVQVTDELDSDRLFSWLHSKDSQGKPFAIMGCVLQTIHFDGLANKDELKTKLHQIIDEL